MRSEVRILSGAMFIEIFCAGPALTNGILLGCEKTRIAAIIDAPQGLEEQIASRIEDLSLTPEFLLLTHSHWDHTADAAFLKKKWDLSLYVHKFDAPNVENPGSDGLPVLIDVPKAEVDHFLEDGQKIQVGELSIEVIHTPGHTPGGVCFYLKDHNVLFSGDTLFRGAIGRLDLPTAESEKMWVSLEKLAQLSPNTRVIPGHGDETTIGAERWLANAKEYFGG